MPRTRLGIGPKWSSLVSDGTEYILVEIWEMRTLPHSFKPPISLQSQLFKRHALSKALFYSKLCFWGISSECQTTPSNSGTAIPLPSRDTFNSFLPWWTILCQYALYLWKCISFSLTSEQPFVSLFLFYLVSANNLQQLLKGTLRDTLGNFISAVCFIN